MTRQLAVWTRGIVVVALAATIACGTRHARDAPKIVILGFDGLDYALTRELIAAGRLPNFARLAAQGGFTALATAIPPQSPVAWSAFITGLDAGGSGIFDFVHRDPATLTPYLSTSRTVPPGRMLSLANWQFPLSAGRTELLRRGRPFWDVLERRGIRTTIIRMPANYPPSGEATEELSGMGTPDLLGTYGTFSVYTSDPSAAGGRTLNGGVVRYVEPAAGVIRASLEGPNQPYRARAEPMTIPMAAYLDATRTYVKVVIGQETRLLKVGEWSDWVPLAFDVRPWQTLHAECRLYLKHIAPYFELYVSPLNLDPLAPAAVASTPATFMTELARATGRFYTQGMPEETKGLKEGVLTTDEFLVQTRFTADENRRQFAYVLDRFNEGLLFYYFGHVDQVSHMLWRARDPGHPAYRADVDGPYAHVIDDLYVELDAVVGETMARLRPTDLLVVMSDHGFTSWRRAFNLNSWLRDQGYLTVRDPGVVNDPGLFSNVDWSRTQAYGLGLNGLYLNLKGREASGKVEPGLRDALLTDVRAKLLHTVDPATGQPVATSVFRSDHIFSLSGTADIAPDLIVGYARGTRVSDESAIGALRPEVLTDNRSAWSGDHCMDPASVPGVLLTSRPLQRPAPSLQTLAAAVLAEFGVERFPQ